MRKEKALKRIRVYRYDALSRTVIKYYCQNLIFYLIIPFRKGKSSLPDVHNRLYERANEREKPLRMRPAL
jgi:hypothetical protein